jgi:hypothetical protein
VVGNCLRNNVACVVPVLPVMRERVPRSCTAGARIYNTINVFITTERVLKTRYGTHVKRFVFITASHRT